MNVEETKEVCETALFAQRFTYWHVNYLENKCIEIIGVPSLELWIILKL